MLAEALAASSSITAIVPATFRAARKPGLGLRVDSQASHAVIYLSWLVYCWQKDMLVGAVSAAAWFILCAFLTLKAVRDGQGAFWIPLATAAAVAFAGMFFGAFGVALVLGLAPAVAEAPQLLSLLRRDAIALSVTAYLLNILRATAWIPYGIANQDLATLLWSTCVCATSLSVAFLLLRLRGLGRQGHGQPAS